MFASYLKIALRNLRKQPGYTFINVTGLAVGIACCILIVLFVRDELSYDRFHADADRIYRVVMDGKIADRILHAPVTPAPMAATLVDEVPEVEAATRLFTLAQQTLVRYEDRQFVEERFFFADSNFFDLFTVELLQGDPQAVLARPNTVVLTTETAARYFPGGEAVGQTIQVDGDDYTVTGIARPLPHNAHFHFDFLATMKGWPPAENTFWVSNNLATYVRLREGASPEGFQAKFDAMMEKYAGPQIQQFLGQSMQDFIKAGNRLTYYLQPLTAIHLGADLEFETEPGGDMAYVYIFSAVAFFILLLACINFMNLATARSAGRAREVGMRKVLGSDRVQLIRQFLAESVLLSLIALVLAVGLAMAALPVLNGLAGKAISHAAFAHPAAIAGLLALGVVVGLLAGSYPAFFLSAFQPITVLKGKFQTSARGAWLRSGLVVFQFAISITLIVSTLVVYNQLTYVRHKQLGWDKEHVVVVQRAGALGDQFRAFKEEVREMPDVVGAGASNTIPGGIFGQTAYQGDGAATGQNFTMSPMVVDHDWVETMGIAMAAGRDFARDFATDSSAYVINEAAARKLGWGDEAVGKHLNLLGANDGAGLRGEVIGVMRDWHFASLHRPIDALAARLTDDPLPFLMVRIRSDNVPATLASLEQAWRRFAPEQPFDYAFLDQSFDTQYEAEQRLGTIFTTFSVFAILIACLGLFGLASFTTQQRTKEIGVRKVMGATVPQIILLLSKEFTRLVLVAFVVAVPVGYLAMSRWLADFAYRTPVHWWIFAAAGLAALAIAVLTVSYQSVRAAVADPVDALRYE